MAAIRGGDIGERRVFILHWSNLSAALQLVLVHAVDVLFGFHLVGGDGQTVPIVLGEGLGLARSHEHTIRIANALCAAYVARERHCDLVHKLVGARGLVHRKDAANECVPLL